MKLADISIIKTGLVLSRKKAMRYDKQKTYPTNYLEVGYNQLLTHNHNQKVVTCNLVLVGYNLIFAVYRPMRVVICI